MLRTIRRFALAFALVVFGTSSLAAAGPYLLVNGEGSDNVVRFDLATGADSLFATYPSGSSPRSLARDDQGNFYSATGGANKERRQARAANGDRRPDSG